MVSVHGKQHCNDDAVEDDAPWAEDDCICIRLAARRGLCLRVACDVIVLSISRRLLRRLQLLVHPIALFVRRCM